MIRPPLTRNHYTDNMAMENADTTDLTMMIKWVTIISFRLTYTLIGQLTTYNPIYWKEENFKNVTELTDYILDTLSTECYMPNKKSNVIVTWVS